MSIQFGCPKCQHVMRVADGNEGRKTRCPQCETVLKIPGTPAAPQGPASPASGAAPSRPPAKPSPSQARPANSGQPQPPPMQRPAPPKPHPKPAEEDPFGLSEVDLGSSRNPFDDLPTSQGNPGGGSAALNPFDSSANTFSPNRPVGAGGGLRQKAKVKLLGPAIGIIVAVLLAAIFQAVSLSQTWDNMMAQMEQMEGPQLIGFRVGFYGMIFYMLISWMFMLMGAAASILVRFPGLAWTGFILGLIPCSTSFFCILALPISIWGIVMLSQKDVKAAFRT